MVACRSLLLDYALPFASQPLSKICGFLSKHCFCSFRYPFQLSSHCFLVYLHSKLPCSFLRCSTCIHLHCVLIQLCCWCLFWGIGWLHPPELLSVRFTTCFLSSRRHHTSLPIDTCPFSHCCLYPLHCITPFSLTLRRASHFKLHVYQIHIIRPPRHFIVKSSQLSSAHSWLVTRFLCTHFTCIQCNNIRVFRRIKHPRHTFPVDSL